MSCWPGEWPRKTGLSRKAMIRSLLADVVRVEAGEGESGALGSRGPQLGADVHALIVLVHHRLGNDECASRAAQGA